MYSLSKDIDLVMINTMNEIELGVPTSIAVSRFNLSVCLLVSGSGSVIVVA